MIVRHEVLRRLSASPYSAVANNSNPNPNPVVCTAAQSRQAMVESPWRNAQSALKRVVVEGKEGSLSGAFPWIFHTSRADCSLNVWLRIGGFGRVHARLFGITWFFVRLHAAVAIVLLQSFAHFLEPFLLFANSAGEVSCAPVIWPSSSRESSGPPFDGGLILGSSFSCARVR